MKSIIILQLTLLSLISCKEEIRRLSPKELYEYRLAELKNPNTNAWDDVPLLDSLGNEINIDDFDPILVAFDSYVDQNDQLRYLVIRKITEEDITYQYKLDSILMFDQDLLDKFLSKLKVDEETRDGIRLGYEQKVYLDKEIYYPLAPIRVQVNCDSIKYILESIISEDQRIRTRGAYDPKVDLKNQALIEDIIKRCGMRSIELEGEEAIKSVFMVVQHADREMRSRYFDQFRAWTEVGSLPQSTLALMIDRMCVDNGEPQLYGTQIMTKSNESILYDLDDIKRVRIRRDSLQMIPLEEYLASFGINQF